MSSIPPTADPTPSLCRRFPVRLARPAWLFGAGITVVVVALALRLGLPVYRQDRAIREVERLGGVVQTSPRGPGWVRKGLGDERMRMFDTVIRVDLNDSQITDAEMFYLSALTDLQWLTLDRTKVGDEGLIQIKDLKKLEGLLLNWTPVTDAGVAHLQRLTDLQKLDLGRTRVTDAGLISIERLTNLEELDLGGTDVTDVGLAHLEGLKKLRRLVLRSVLQNKRVTRKGVADLQHSLPDLKVSSG
ncbi:MAG TPA: hypothetical protein VGM05_20595 [Planctomycetaceae bacterium]|jgi:hypothetical protein